MIAKEGILMIQSGDFVKLNFTGKLDDGAVFDTTIPEVAKTEGMEGTKTFKPIIICVGQRMLVPGLDTQLIGRQPGKFTVKLSPDESFGRKDPKLLKIVPTMQLVKQQINPYPGLRLNIDGNYGTVRTVSSGRTIVDFNHPLASQDVIYDVEVLEIVKDQKDQIMALLDGAGLPYKEVTAEGDNAVVKLNAMFPKPILDMLQNKITQLTSVKTVSFEQGKKPEAVSEAKSA